MLVYGICAGPSGKVDRIALPALRRADPEGHVLVRTGQTSIFEAYNSMLDEALALGPAVEGLVLLHDDLELLDESVAPALRAAFAEPAVGLVGLVGGRGERIFKWWDGDARGHVRELEVDLDYSRGLDDVDTLDGIFLALSPAGMRAVRFDGERFSGFHGYDADVSRAMAAAGLRVVTTDIDALHHVTVAKINGLHSYRLAGLEWQDKWLRSDPLAVRAPRRFRLARARAQNRWATAAERRGHVWLAAQLRRRVPEARKPE